MWGPSIHSPPDPTARCIATSCRFYLLNSPPGRPLPPSPLPSVWLNPHQRLPGLLPQGMSTRGLLLLVHSAASGSFLKQKVTPLLKTHPSVPGIKQRPLTRAGATGLPPLRVPPILTGPNTKPSEQVQRNSSVCNTWSTVRVPCGF